MRRGQTRRPIVFGFTKQELLDACDLSAKSFDTLRKAARVKGPSHGGLNHVFSVEDLIQLIHRGESGKFTIRGAPASKAWRILASENGIFVPPRP